LIQRNQRRVCPANFQFFFLFRTKKRAGFPRAILFRPDRPNSARLYFKYGENRRTKTLVFKKNAAAHLSFNILRNGIFLV